MTGAAQRHQRGRAKGVVVAAIEGAVENSAPDVAASIRAAIRREPVIITSPGIVDPAGLWCRSTPEPPAPVVFGDYDPFSPERLR